MASNFENFLLQLPKVSVLKTSFDTDKYVLLDLSIQNSELQTFDIHDIAFFERYWKKIVSDKNGNIAYGGYFEQRNLYQRSKLFEKNIEKRDIHVGLDLWADAETPVLAAFDGVVSGSNYNEGVGNYGGTIILKHSFNGFEFFTLYGHLSIESIRKLPKQSEVLQGEFIGNLGFPHENGSYAPHLHFQIIQKMDPKIEDYPGVCTKSDAVFFADNCPDPNLILKINHY